MPKLLRWLDDRLLFLFAGFLLAFIPLYPKLPLLDVLPGYIVRIRLEDILIAGCFVLWLIYLLRRKITLSGNPLLKPIAGYLAVGLLSIISAIFVIRTIPQESLHIQKSLLHFFRRVEYFSLFFIFFTSVKNIKQIKTYLIILIITALLVSLYGFGQKYLYWPAYSTMNREFAKGWQLYLTEHARVLSTFGGHYDLAAFAMMMLIILWSLFFGLKNLFWRLLVLPVLAVVFWTLILTASRTSFIAYLTGLILMFFFWSYKKGIFWAISRYLIVSFTSIIIMLSFGDLSERFTKLLRIDQRLLTFSRILKSPIGKPPGDKALFLENNPQAALSEITSKSDAPPKLARPSDVFEDIPLVVEKNGSRSAVKRTYSQTAFMYDLSTAIRFDALWPMAIKGFAKNPLLGSGYATLNKSNLTDFTEAESTDNDFLRSLGETGILGFAFFYGTLLFIVFYLWRSIEVLKDPLIFAFIAGFAGLLSGLLVNAVYIDVFESSKVALSFWALTGITLSAVKIARTGKGKVLEKPRLADLDKFITGVKSAVKKIITSHYFYLFLIMVLAFSLRLYRIKTPLADWHSWRQADTASVSRNFIKQGINVLYPTYDDLSNVASGYDNPKGLRFVEFPVYNVVHVFVDQLITGYDLVIKGRLTSVIASLFSCLFLFLIVRKYHSAAAAFLSSFFFAVIPYNIFFSRVILPEPLLVATSLAMVYFFDKWLEKKSLSRMLPALIFSALSLLIKPFAAFLFLPMIYLWFIRFRFKAGSVAGLLLFMAAASLPLLIWRWWAGHFPEGIPANMWLLNGDGIRFKGAFFYWLFADRLGRLILGYFGLPLLVFGILAEKNREGHLFNIWGLSMLLYITVFATGNVRHDYYQVLTIPVITIFLAKGVLFLISQNKNLSGRLKVYAILIVLFIFMEMFGWYFIRDFYNINHPEIVEAGRAVELKTPGNSLVIAPYNGDTAFLFQTQRAGWPVMEKSVEEMIGMGAHFYVSVNFDGLTDRLFQDSIAMDPVKRKYKLIEKTDKFVLIQLVPDRKLPK